MSEDKVLAVLVPSGYGDSTREAFRHKHNLRYFKEVTVSRSTPVSSFEDVPTNDCEQLTRESSPVVDLGEISLHSLDRLELSLADDNAPIDITRGWTFGSDTTKADVYLGPKDQGFSGIHFSLYVGQDLRIWLRDHSKAGTCVKYDDRSSGVRKKDTWVLSFTPGSIPEWSTTTICVQHLSFRIAFCNHDKPSARYLEALHEFLERANAALPDLDVSLRSRVQTRVASRAPNSPRTQRPFLLEQSCLHCSKLAEVKRVVNTRTGQRLALKRFFGPSADEDPNSEEQCEDRKQWSDELKRIREQTKITRDATNRHIVPVLEFWEDNNPMLLMPYYELGSLNDILKRRTLSHAEVCSYTRQLLIAISVVHAQKAAHRDIKPGNILFQDETTIVLADFGSSRYVEDDQSLASVTGTRPYCAPEYWQEDIRYTGASFDIWSAGVVMLRMLRPALFAGWNRWMRRDDMLAWARRVSDFHRSVRYDAKLQREAQLLDGMLVEDPRRRLTATQCLERGFLIGLFNKDASGCYVDGDSGPPGASEPSALVPTEPNTATSDASTYGPQLARSCDSPVTGNKRTSDDLGASSLSGSTLTTKSSLFCLKSGLSEPDKLSEADHLDDTEVAVEEASKITQCTECLSEDRASKRVRRTF